MSKTRRKHSGEFKTKIVLEMLKGVETPSEISSKYGIHPTQVTKWKCLSFRRSPGPAKDRSGSAPPLSLEKIELKIDLQEKN
jgi:transposase